MQGSTGWEGMGWFIRRTGGSGGMSPRDVSASFVLPEEVFLTRATHLGFASNLVPECAGQAGVP